jgi:Fe2+ or Zn2+ uptake regulation protein
MVRLGEEVLPQLQGKSPREIYDFVREAVSQAPDASINDFFETLDWLVQKGVVTEAELEAVEEEEG